MTLDGGYGEATAGTGAPTPVLHPEDPRRLGGVRLLGRLGEGGMGVVFLGERDDGRRVAVKVIRADYARDDGFRARFAAEAAAARRVARFCTAQVLDAGTDGDLAYLVTEYIDGPTLTAALEQDGPMRGSTLDGLAIGVAAALNGIHAAGIVHRDLKPSNVLLSRVGPKVIDFGIARALDALERLTESGHLVGTPAYMAPEQFRGTTTTATDVFSWGAVVTFAATGRPPFGAGSPYQLMHRIVSDPPALGDLDGPLRDLVARALDKEPVRRPTARALLLALVGDAGDPIDASSRILSTRWNPPPAATAAGPTPGRPDVDDTAAPTRSRRTPVLLALVAAVLVAAVVTVVETQGSAHGGNPGGGGRPTVGASTAPASPSPGGSGTTGTPVAISIGVRVPASGVISLGVGEVRRYRLHLAAARDVYVTGYVCSDLVPWQLVHAGGALVGSDTLGCRQSGPYALPAGDYELRVGGSGMDGKYALTLDGR